MAAKSDVSYEDLDLQLEIDDDDDFAVVKGDYASIIFQNLAEKYPVNAHIECKYTLTRTYEPGSRDWIGLYKVGWSSPRDYKTYQWAVIPDSYKPNENNVAKVLFQAHNLPDDDGEFYQFCYIGGGQVKGASVPFQFKRPRGDEFVAIEGEDDDDLMIIRTKTAVLQDSLDAALNKEKTLEVEKKKLESEKEILQRKLEELDKYLEEKNEQVNDVEKLLEARERELEEVADLLHKTKEAKSDLLIKVSDLEKALKDSAVDREMEVMKGKEETTGLKLKHNQKEERILELNATIKSLHGKIDEINGKTMGLEKEKELYKTHFNSTEENLRSVHGEHASLQKLIDEKDTDISGLKAEISAAKEAIDTLKDGIDQEKQKSEKMGKKCTATQECVLHLQDQLSNTKDRAAAAEQCKLMLDEQMKAYIAAYEGSARDLVDARGEIHDLKDQVKKKDMLLSEAVKRLAKLNSEMEWEKDALTSKVAALEEERTRIIKEKEDLHNDLSGLQSRITELQNWKSNLEQKNKLASSQEVLVDGATGEVTSSSGFSEPEVEAADAIVSSDAALHALRMVNSHLEKRLSTKEKQIKKLTKSYVDLERSLANKSTEDELKKQVEDLKRRLSMGAEEYKKKWVECRKLQKKMEKFKKDRSDSQSEIAESIPRRKRVSEHGERVFSIEIEQGLKQRLEQVKEKKNKFKQLYENECEKNAALQMEIESLLKLLKQQDSSCQSEEPREVEPVRDDDAEASGEKSHVPCADVIIKQPVPTSGPTSSVSSPTPVPKSHDGPHIPAPSSPILKPLPPPMMPVVLPTAKMRAVIELPPSPKELEKTLLSSTVKEEVLVLPPPRGLQESDTESDDDGPPGLKDTSSECSDSDDEKPPALEIRGHSQCKICSCAHPCPCESSTAEYSRKGLVKISSKVTHSTADGETGIPEEVSVNVDPINEEREEFFLAPEPSQPVTPPVLTPCGSPTRPKAVPLQPPPLPPRRSQVVVEEIPVKCEDCSFLFPRGASDAFIANHIQEHAGRLCPVCSQTFPAGPGKAQKTFEDHVQKHFESDDLLETDGETVPMQERSPHSFSPEFDLNRSAHAFAPDFEFV